MQVIVHAEVVLQRWCCRGGAMIKCPENVANPVENLAMQGQVFFPKSSTMRSHSRVKCFEFQACAVLMLTQQLMLEN
jgi:hypothetical protein